MNKLAIITGASSGIGLACARQFLQLGYTVINISRRPAGQPGIVDLCCNLAWESALADVLGTLQARFLSQPAEVCLLHNAARMVSDRVDDYDTDDLKLALAVQVMAPAAINRALVPLMAAGSSILYIGSTLSEQGVANAFSYTSCKHAVLGMMRASCQDLLGSGIHTACICPGFTDTPMLQQRLTELPALAEVACDNGAARLASADEIAELVVWAHQHALINGSVLHGNFGQRQR